MSEIGWRSVNINSKMIPHGRVRQCQDLAAFIKCSALSSLTGPNTWQRHLLKSELQRQLERGLERMHIEVTDEQSDALVTYVNLIAKWNKVINLTAVRDPQQMISRHILDSLSVHEYINSDSLIDVGAGAGLPGIPLAILKPHMNVTLIDSVAKKTRFIQQAATRLSLANVNAIHSRVESVTEQADIVIARAFAAPDKLAALAHHLLPPMGRLLAMVGQVPEPELLANISGFSWLETAKLTIPDETAERNIVILQRDSE